MSGSGARRIDVVAIGETMVQLVPHRSRLQDAGALHVGIGGAESNTACFLAAAGRTVSWIGAVGADPLGARVLDAIRAYGVDVSRVTVDPGAPTGVYLKDPDPADGTTVYYYRRGSAASRLSIDRIDLPHLRAVRVVHLTGVTPAISEAGAELVSAVQRRAREAGALLSFDVNHRPALWSASDAAPILLARARASDLVFVGLDEARTIWGCATPEDVRALLPTVRLVVKDGAVGATSFAPDGSVVVAPAHPVEVVEPVGAGDAFAAGYLHALLADAGEEARLEAGHRFAAAALRSLHDVATPEEVRAVADGLGVRFEKVVSHPEGP